MEKRNIVFSYLCVGLIFFTYACVDCIEDDSENNNLLSVVTDWSNLWPSVTKPESLNIKLFDTVTHEQTEHTIHSDNGVIDVIGEDYNILLYTKGGKNEHLRFKDMDNYHSATAFVNTYFINNEEIVKQPGLLWGENYSDFSLNRTSYTLHTSPVAYTKLLHLDIITVGDLSYSINSCNGSISGFASSVNLSTKQPDDKKCKIIFDTHKIESRYEQQLIHFGYSDLNVLYLIFSCQDGQEKEIRVDITEPLHSLIENTIYCKIIVDFGLPHSEPEVDVIIEPWSSGIIDNITIH